MPAFVPTALLANGHNTTSSKILSGFAHGVFHQIDKISLTAGVRSSKDTKDEQFDNAIVITSLDTETNHFDWKAGIDFKLAQGLMLCASEATRYFPQAFNPRPFRSRSSCRWTARRRPPTKSASRATSRTAVCA